MAIFRFVGIDILNWYADKGKVMASNLPLAMSAL
jgi:hypothetical protein